MHSVSRWQKTDWILFLHASPGLRLGLITPLDLDETKSLPLLLIVYGISFICILMFSSARVWLLTKCVFHWTKQRQRPRWSGCEWPLLPGLGFGAGRFTRCHCGPAGWPRQWIPGPEDPACSPPKTGNRWCSGPACSSAVRSLRCCAFAHWGSWDFCFLLFILVHFDVQCKFLQFFTWFWYL